MSLWHLQEITVECPVPFKRNSCTVSLRDYKKSLYNALCHLKEIPVQCPCGIYKKSLYTALCHLKEIPVWCPCGIYKKSLYTALCHLKETPVHCPCAIYKKSLYTDTVPFKWYLHYKVSTPLKVLIKSCICEQALLYNWMLQKLKPVPTLTEGLLSREWPHEGETQLLPSGVVHLRIIVVSTRHGYRHALRVNCARWVARTTVRDGCEESCTAKYNICFQYQQWCNGGHLWEHWPWPLPLQKVF